MQKDVIYIDVEDDITAIIGKVKASKEKVVALVPPKRIGVLQSAVNLRLLTRAGDQSKKHIVLITNNQALVGLASAAKIPVAKNLQSKPEVPEIAALSVDDDDDVIDGEQLPVGELAKTAHAAAPKQSSVPDDAVGDLDIDGDTPKKAVPPVAGAAPAKPRVKSGVKVPSFNKFRKKIFIFGGLGIALIIFLVWAIWFAPRATVEIDARTSDKDLRTTVTVGQDLDSDAGEGTLKAIQQQEKQTDSIDFDATGTQQVGEKAKGTMTITRDGVSSSSTTIPIGTGFSSGNYTFTTTATVEVPRSQIVGNGIDHGTVTVNVQAMDVGEDFNLSARAYQSSVGGFSASGSAMSGGSKREIKVVTQSDVIKAKEQLSAQNSNEIKAKLAKKFGTGVTVIDSSFEVTGDEPQSSPAIGQEAANGKAKLTRAATYVMTGISDNDLDTFLKSALEKTLNTDDQRVYDTGYKKVKLTDFKAGDRSSTVAIEATGQVGPKIDDAKIKEQVKGKRYGEIQSDLKAIEGVNDADTKLWPFWVQTVPNDTSKIKIEFKLKNGEQ